jgi:hypothetical protein
MTLTTIKVTMATRDRLKAAARADRSTLEEFLERLVSEHERRERLSAMRAAVAATSSDVMAAYVDEAAEWEHAEAASRG